MKFLTLATAFTFMSAAVVAQALEVKPYSAAALAEAQKADKPVALHFRADWCPTCRAQDKVLESLKSEPGLDLTVYSVDYDHEKALNKQYDIRGQSTLVMLHGKQERGRAMGEITSDGIRKALKSAL